MTTFTYREWFPKHATQSLIDSERRRMMSNNYYVDRITNKPLEVDSDNTIPTSVRENDVEYTIYAIMHDAAKEDIELTICPDGSWIEIKRQYYAGKSQGTLEAKKKFWFGNKRVQRDAVKCQYEYGTIRIVAPKAKFNNSPSRHGLPLEW